MISIDTEATILERNYHEALAEGMPYAISDAQAPSENANCIRAVLKEKLERLPVIAEVLQDVGNNRSVITHTSK